MPTQQENYARIAKLLENIDIAMFTTRGRDGYLVSRPLSTQVANFDGTIWFMVSAESSKVGEIARDPHVNVGYAAKDKNTYVSVAGTAQVLRDQARIDALWNDFYKAFWPDGPTDPRIRLVRVDVATVEYWDGPGTIVGQAIRFAIARVTRDDSVLSDNKTLRVTGTGRARVVTDGDPNDPGSRRGRTGSSSSKATGTRAAAKKAGSRASTGRAAVTGTSRAKKAGTRTAGARKAAARKTAASKSVAGKSATRKSTAKKASASRATGTRASSTSARKSPARKTARRPAR